MKCYKSSVRYAAGGLALLASAYCANEFANNNLSLQDAATFLPSVALFAAALYQSNRDNGREVPSPRDPSRIRRLTPPPLREVLVRYTGTVLVGAFAGISPGLLYTPAKESDIPEKILEHVFTVDSIPSQQQTTRR